MNCAIVLIAGLLLSRYESAEGDPEHVEADLVLLEKYYDMHPETRELMESVKGFKWTIRYREMKTSTAFYGNRVRLTRAVIYFDPRAGGEFRNGERIPPAGALLHELLHIKLASEKPQDILGPAKVGIYPFLHERKVIQAEQDLFRAIDIPGYRSRNDHTGKFIPVECVWCLQ